MTLRSFHTIPGEGNFEFFIDNSGVDSARVGLHYRHSPIAMDRDRRIKVAEYGSTIFAQKFNEEWVRVHDRKLGCRYLPMKVGGVEVLRKNMSNTPLDIEKQASAGDHSTHTEVVPKRPKRRATLSVPGIAYESFVAAAQKDAASDVLIARTDDQEWTVTVETVVVAEPKVPVQMQGTQELEALISPEVFRYSGMQTQVVHSFPVVHVSLISQPTGPNMQAQLQLKPRVSIPSAFAQSTRTTAAGPQFPKPTMKMEKRLSSVFRKRAVKSNGHCFCKEAAAAIPHRRAVDV